MALAYNVDRATDDVDATFQPRDVVLDAAETVAAEAKTWGWSDIDKYWLSDANARSSLSDSATAGTRSDAASERARLSPPRSGMTGFTRCAGLVRPAHREVHPQRPMETPALEAR